MIFESHAHYDDKSFDGDRDALLLSMKDKNVEYIINVSAAVKGIDDTAVLMQKYPFVYGAIGVHPDEVGDLNEEIMQHMQELCQHEKTVAVGEIGLDYYWDKEHHDNQIYWFERQLTMAREQKLPFIIHSREAAADTMEVMKRLHAGDIGGVVHCYSYSKEIAREYLKMGLSFGIGGVVTFNNAKKLKEVVEYLPLESILLETDSPYLAPVPYRGKRNDSSYISYIAKEIAQIKGISQEEVIEVTYKNAKNLFTKVR